MGTTCTHRYRVVDVFSEVPLEGNPLAVFPDSPGLSTQVMQKIALELNLSETVFVNPPTRSDCAARLRIFTPRKEMDFAGHPTVGTAYVLLDEGRVAKETETFAVEENVGAIPIRVVDGPPITIWLMTPPLKEEGQVDQRTAADLLGLELRDLLDFPPQILNAGNPTLYIPLIDREAVDRASFNSAAWMRSKLERPIPCVFAFSPTAYGAYSRMFAPDYGILEDPATGSSTGPLAFYMMKHRLAPSKHGTRFHSEQGTKMGRRSILHIQIHGEGGVDGIAVGGHVTPVIEGTLTL